MKSPKVSVLMPVYNGEKYVEETIQSILNQTFTDFEFIIIDDCSTDKSVEIIQSFKDERIVFIQNEYNIGISATRNKLMDVATGEYFAITDNDDISLPHRFEKQVNYLDEHTDVGVVGSWFEYFPDYKLISPPEHYTYLDLLKWNPHISHPSSMIRGTIFKKYNLRYDDNYRYTEDYEIWSQAIHYMKIANLQEVLFKYRWHGENMSILKLDVQLKHDKEVKENILNFLTQNKDLKEKIKRVVFDNASLAKENKIKSTYYLFNILPIFKIKYRENSKHIYLFGFLPILKIKWR